MSLVLRGNFNPSIFQPAWLAKHGLVREEEATHAEIQIITPEVTMFKIAKDLSILVQQNQFQIDTLAPEAGLPLRDLALGIFRILEHTPISAMGLNRHMHFKMQSEGDWNTVGHMLAPKQLWSGLLQQPGTRSVVVEEKRSDSEGKLVVTVQPSEKVSPGVYVGVNKHYDGDGPTLMDTLTSTWETTQLEARKIAETLMERCLETQ